MLGIFPNFPVLDVNAIIYLFVESMFLIAIGVYLIFAFIAARQIDNMQNTVITPLSPLIRLIGYLHFFLAVGVLIFTIVYLKA